jgi:hypothetical protein
MAETHLMMKFLEHCAFGELVRARFATTSEWGIVASLAHGFAPKRCVVVISGNDAPRCLSPEDTGRVSACLSYGNAYGLLPEYGGPCDIISAGGLEFTDFGTLIYASPVPKGSTERYLLARSPGHISTHFILNLDDFKLTGGQPGGNRAGFKQWSIWMKLPPDPDRPVKLFGHGQGDT